MNIDANKLLKEVTRKHLNNGKFMSGKQIDTAKHEAAIEAIDIVINENKQLQQQNDELSKALEEATTVLNCMSPFTDDKLTTTLNKCVNTLRNNPKL